MPTPELLRFASPRPLLIALALGVSPMLTGSQARAVELAFTDLSSDFNISFVIQQLLEAGDLPLLQKIAAPHTKPMRGGLLIDSNIALARAWIFLGDNKTALGFALAAHADAPANPVARWLAAELAYTLNDEAAGDDLARIIAGDDPTDPAIPYLNGRKLLAKIARQDASFNTPQLKADHATAQDYVKQCCSTVAQSHERFDPRFLSLGIDVGMLDLNYPFAAEYAAQLCALRPRNAPLARLTLALAFNQATARQKLLADLRSRNTLPTKELDRWDARAKLFDATPDNSDALCALSDSTKADSLLANTSIHFLARAASALPKDDPRFEEFAQKYADTALASRSVPHARAAFWLLSPDSKRIDANPELRIELARLARLNEIAAMLVGAMLDSKKDDYRWLVSHRAIAAASQTPTGTAAYGEHLGAMKRLFPDTPIVLISVARFNYRTNSPAALNDYDRAFAAVPQSLEVTLQDWLAYRFLIDAIAAEKTREDAGEHFDAHIERIHNATPTDLNAAHFYAELLDRRAATSMKSEDRIAATIAFKTALGLDPAAGDLLADMRGKSPQRPTP